MSSSDYLLMFFLVIAVFVAIVVPAVGHLLDKYRRTNREFVYIGNPEEGMMQPTPEEKEMMRGADEIHVDIDDCPRCRKSHEGVEFTRFGGNPIAGFTHYGSCEDTGAPILICVNIAGEGVPTKPPQTPTEVSPPLSYAKNN